MPAIEKTISESDKTEVAFVCETDGEVIMMPKNKKVKYSEDNKLVAILIAIE